MVGPGASAGESGISRSLSRLKGKALEDMDLKKQVRKPKAQPADEGIIEGVTHDSIERFVKASKAAKHAPRNPPTFSERLSRFFRRS